jgi:hypothetical protein
LAHGTVPPFAAFSKHLDTALNKHGELIWKGEATMTLPSKLHAEIAQEVLEATQLLRTGGAVSSVEGEWTRHRLHVRILGKKALWTFLKAAARVPDGNLAGHLMDALGYEWI